DTVLVYLRGSKALIEARMRARKGHFMPPALLDSQFATLEEPGEDEHPIVVDIGGAPEAIIAKTMHHLQERLS
ncbi:MAG TPA: gluconokinase, partial [Rhodopila sp.]